MFVPSNPWLAVGWREREAITFALRPSLERQGIDFIAQPVTRIDAAASALELQDGRRIDYDHLVITTGPKLAFDEVPGAGPAGHTVSICTVDHAEEAYRQYQRFLREPAPRSSGRSRVPRASVRPTSSPSSSTRTCSAGASARRCR